MTKKKAVRKSKTTTPPWAKPAPANREFLAACVEQAIEYAGMVPHLITEWPDIAAACNRVALMLRAGSAQEIEAAGKLALRKLDAPYKLVMAAEKKPNQRVAEFSAVAAALAAMAAHLAACVTAEKNHKKVAKMTKGIVKSVTIIAENVAEIFSLGLVRVATVEMEDAFRHATQKPAKKAA